MALVHTTLFVTCSEPKYAHFSPGLAFPPGPGQAGPDQQTWSKQLAYALLVNPRGYPVSRGARMCGKDGAGVER